jgi:hypothetical protein
MITMQHINKNVTIGMVVLFMLIGFDPSEMLTNRRQIKFYRLIRVLFTKFEVKKIGTFRL